MLIFINSWEFFCVSFGLMLLFALIMSMQRVHFYTKDVIVKKFGIMDLELPASSTELTNLMAGLYKLPEPQSRKAIRALKTQLYLDFLFMPCAYLSILSLCLLVSDKMQSSVGTDTFFILAWLQLLSWLCDIIENIYLLGKISPNPMPSSPSVHKSYLVMEAIKWGIALIATVSAVAAICYFWLAGHYEKSSLQYLLIIIIEIVLFLLLTKLAFKESKQAVLQ